MREDNSRERYRQLIEYVRELGRVVVAFSGGVDSSLLLAAAADAQPTCELTAGAYADGDRVLAITASSPTYTDAECHKAGEISRFLGVRHRIVKTCEFDNRDFLENRVDRCYWCKRELFVQLCDTAQKEGYDAVLDGSNMDDLDDYRPGSQAAREFGVISPLQDLKIGKILVREMAKMRGLSNWNQPACACLASRIPYGERITMKRLEKIRVAEERIAALGFRVLRVRDHGDIARIEVGPSEIRNATEDLQRHSMIEICREVGFRHVCLDLKGYRTGSLNEGVV